MPEVLRVDGFKFIIYYNDHDPAHVHVIKGSNQARIQLDPTALMDAVGFNRKDIRRILEITATSQAQLLKEWKRIEGWRLP